MTDILSQLKQLGVTLGMPEQPKQKKTEKSNRIHLLESSFQNGQIIENRFGTVFLNRIRYPLSEPHGIVCMDQAFHENPLFDLLIGQDRVNKFQTLAMDTETSGLSTGAASFVFMIGLGYFEHESYVVDQLILPDLSHEQAFLYEIERYFSRFNFMLTYNGKSFDIPMIRNRANFYSFPNFCDDIQHIDLLTIVRRFWRDEMENCRLATVEREILQLQRSAEEVPGYLAPELYRDFLDSGNAETLKGIAYHNQIDVKSLSALLLLLNSLEPDGITKASEGVQLLNKKVVKHWRWHQMDPSNVSLYCCAENFTVSQRKAAAAKWGKKGESDLMIEILISLAAEGEFSSIIKLADFYSAQPDKIFSAILLLERALEILASDSALGFWSREKKGTSIRKKKEKLIQKIRGQGQ